MPVSAGKLRHKLSLQLREADQDPVTGEPLFTWVEIANIWASIEPLSVKDYIASKAQQSEVTARIVIRHRQINPQMRLVHRASAGEKIYKIIGILPDPDSGMEYITLAVSEGVSKG